MATLSQRYYLKSVLLGPEQCGKTALRNRSAHDTFEEKYKPTIGADFSVKNQEIRGEETVHQIWDVGGQPKFEALVSTFMRGAYSALICFDLTKDTDMATLNKNHGLVLTELDKESQSRSVIVGCKSDLTDERKANEKEIRKWCMDRGLRYFECSAKDNVNLTEIFEYIGETQYDTHWEFRSDALVEINDEWLRRVHSMVDLSSKRTLISRKGLPLEVIAIICSYSVILPDWLIQGSDDEDADMVEKCQKCLDFCWENSKWISKTCPIRIGFKRDTIIQSADE